MTIAFAFLRQFLWVCRGTTVSHSTAVCLYLIFSPPCISKKKQNKTKLNQTKETCDAVTRGKLSRSSVTLHLGCQSWGNDVPTSQGCILHPRVVVHALLCIVTEVLKEGLVVTLEVSFLLRSCGSDSCRLSATKAYFKAGLCFSAAILPEDAQGAFAPPSLPVAVCWSVLCCRCTWDGRLSCRVLSSYIKTRPGTCVIFVSVWLSPTQKPTEKREKQGFFIPISRKEIL